MPCESPNDDDDDDMRVRVVGFLSYLSQLRLDFKIFVLSSSGIWHVWLLLPRDFERIDEAIESVARHVEPSDLVSRSASYDNEPVSLGNRKPPFRRWACNDPWIPTSSG